MFTPLVLPLKQKIIHKDDVEKVCETFLENSEPYLTVIETMLDIL